METLIIITSNKLNGRIDQKGIVGSIQRIHALTEYIPPSFWLY